jgi:hypothetical protein
VEGCSRVGPNKCRQWHCLSGCKNKKIVWFFNAWTMGYALEREYVKGKSIVGGKDNFFNQNVGSILSHHIVQIKGTIAE